MSSMNTTKSVLLIPLWILMLAIVALGVIESGKPAHLIDPAGFFRRRSHGHRRSGKVTRRDNERVSARHELHNSRDYVDAECPDHRRCLQGGISYNKGARRFNFNHECRRALRGPRS